MLTALGAITVTFGIFFVVLFIKEEFDFVNGFMFVIVWIMVLFFTYMIMAAVIGVSADKACLALGWRDSSITWDLQPYCIARTDQTDIVVPLSKAYKR